MGTFGRRQLLVSIASLGTANQIAGCIGADDGTDEDDSPPENVPARIHTFLQHARGYDESIVDERGQEQVNITVGAGSGGLAYDPAAVRVDVGTTVVWSWTGDGGAHDVVSTGGSDFSFQSERTREAETTFEYTFDDGGVALYECRPHRTQGMLGAIEIMFPEDTVHADE